MAEPHTKRGAGARALLLDLGGVVVGVDRAALVRNLAAACRVSKDVVVRALFDDGLKARYDLGDLDTAGMWRAFADATGCRGTFLGFARAYTHIFEPLMDNLSLFEEVSRAGFPVYVLSNTDPLHFGYIRASIPLVAGAEGVAPSFLLRAVKPDPEFFARAAELLGYDPAGCLFVDDRSDNRATAVGAGLTAVDPADRGTLARALRGWFGLSLE